MERHFECTACGKCCQGWLPLSLDDALRHADRFPLFLLWTPVRQGGKSFDLTARLGFTIKLKNRKQAAVRLTAMSYVPSNTPCPALREDGLCAVHDTKPQRCRTMPLSGSRAESDQTDLLIPAPGWECDISTAAPVLYRDKKIVERAAFEDERTALEKDAEILRPFAQLMLDSLPSLRMELEKMALRPQGGHVIVNFSTLLPRLGGVDIHALAAQQAPVMEAFAALTAGDPQYKAEHQRYVACAEEWRRIMDDAP
ncbi:YkgJ family cysteine cluster protein [Magnetovibrio sp.]|uniref:YkgJ family cysteine cluster protein n=1 Tax=Magnetovibrio sp. TaxID=2024836 RepID=UPI002F9284E1